ncbi:hypothetical protein I3842_06G141900 [Carya illinoinensis]|uniref:HTH La-type RNA-binding domain-containing protein n=1 Tax=Carya illinoinensis TaxID=32201 RepID=A0A922JI90_CARIL|nr:hypothetical protein I3842_06G141900 [Carya illinoinensis]
MGQAQKTPEREKCTKKTYDDMSFKFNARAREFVPRSYTQMPASAYFYPGFNFLGRSIGGGSDWLFVGYQEPPAYLISNPDVVAPRYRTKTVLTDDLKQKIIKQVEYQFSNMNLLANESFVKHMTEDPNGYVPISAIASVKKIKSLVSNNPMLAQALRSSSRLVCHLINFSISNSFSYFESSSHKTLQIVSSIL